MKYFLFFLASVVFCFSQESVLEGLPLYYWRKPNFQNFGDHLSLKIVERILGRDVSVYQKGDVIEKRFLAIGSLLGAAKENDVLWGTGMNGKVKLTDYKFSHLDVRAVRGPLTRKFLWDNFQIDAPAIYGDPALLFPYLFPEFTRNPDPTIDVLIIPHYSEEMLFPKGAHKDVVYPSEPWDQVIRKILDSRFVVSSSLHGLIIAEAYGIPARYLRVTNHEPLFKYQDYYLGTNRPNFRYATSLMEAIEMRGEAPFYCDLERLYDAFPFEFWPSTVKHPLNFAGRILPPLKEDPLLPVVYPTDPSSGPEDNFREEVPIDPLCPDLEANPPQFILETKKIYIPGHERAFNPSLVRWRGALLLSFRINDPSSDPTRRTGLVWLDENYEPLGPAMILHTPFFHPTLLSLQQDPRLLVVNDRLYIVYNNVIDLFCNNKALKRMFMAELEFDGSSFHIKDQECLMEYPGQSVRRWEKNWVPFSYEDTFLFAYSIFPHLVLEPLLGTQSCRQYSCIRQVSPWKWGEVRGGTQALLDGDHYLGFFHSTQYLASQQSEGKVMLHYFMGAYTFSATPPFSITAISPEPIIGKNFYNGPAYKTWKPLRVVFPGGMLLDENYVWVAYGRQDNEVWITKLDKKLLLESLVPVSPAKEY